MSATTNDFFAIEVDADDYAEAAAGDVPSVPRTFQSEADFELQKASYSAKISHGNNYEAFLAATHLAENLDGEDLTDDAKITLDKKQVQLLGYAVGELYFDHRYAVIIELCRRIRGSCAIDRRLSDNLEKWSQRSRERLTDSHMP